MTNPVFIYCPRSGDRVIAARPAADGIPAIIGWGNECRHVVGGIHLVYEASAPRRHWRDAARQMASLIIDAAGGIAWDDRGTIHVAVPRESAGSADRWMRATRAAALGEHPVSERLGWPDLNEASLAMAGVRAVYVPGPGRDDRARATIARDGDRWRVTIADRDGDVVGVVTAPSAWGPPVVIGPAVETVELGPAPEPAEADTEA
jgi:hypothetical protein